MRRITCAPKTDSTDVKSLSLRLATQRTLRWAGARSGAAMSRSRPLTNTDVHTLAHTL